MSDKNQEDRIPTPEEVEKVLEEVNGGGNPSGPPTEGRTRFNWDTHEYEKFTGGAWNTVPNPYIMSSLD